MIIYKCILSGDEMFTDIYKLKVNGAFYEVEGKMITRTDNAIDESLIGGNASAEEQSESLESSSTSGVDIVLNHKLQETTFDKTSYKVYIKDYMKAVKAKLQEENPEKVAGFVKEAQEAVKDVLKDFKDLQFFTGESMNPEAMVGLLNYREDGITPYMLFFKDGLVTEKC